MAETDWNKKIKEAKTALELLTVEKEAIAAGVDKKKFYSDLWFNKLYELLPVLNTIEVLRVDLENLKQIVQKHNHKDNEVVIPI